MPPVDDAKRPHTRHSGVATTLPQGIDLFFRAVAYIKRTFTVPELKALLEAHRTMPVFPEPAPQARLALSLAEHCTRANLHTRFGFGRSAFEAKIKRLDAVQATALMIWAAAFWKGHDRSAGTMDAYVASSHGTRSSR